MMGSVKKGTFLKKERPFVCMRSSVIRSLRFPYCR